MSRVPVMAESQHAFKQYIEEHKLNRGHFDYISGEGSIRGRRGVILTVGKWWRNPNFQRNEDFAQILNGMVNTGCISLIPAVWESEDRRNLL